MARLLQLLVVTLFVSAIGCGKSLAQTSATPSTASTNLTYYQAKGVVQEVKPEAKSVTIKHEAVPNYMPAMTMPFDVRDTNELTGLAPGDSVTFRMVIAGNDAWIDQIKKLDVPRAADPRLSYHLVRDVDPLNIGDPLPEYHFTNELGHAVSTSQFKGRAFAFTFFFTHCPYPTFCPLMSNHFKETQQKLLALPDGPKNWHLFSISFDTDQDTPETLKAYAERYNYDPSRWSFLTGDVLEITAIGDQVGEVFGRDGAYINHNLRTVVIDTRGRVQKIFPGNTWTPDELMAEIVKAAAMK